MSRKDTTASLSKLLEKHIDPHRDARIYWAREVTFDFASEHPVRVDYMKFKPVNNTVSGIEKGDFYCYEVKSSTEDFHSKNGHNFIGDLNYYVMPEPVYESIKNLIPYNVGVLVQRNVEFYGDVLQIIKNAKRKDRSKPASEMLLMMYRSSRRDSVKAKTAEDKAAQAGEGEQDG